MAEPRSPEQGPAKRTREDESTDPADSQAQNTQQQEWPRTISSKRCNSVDEAVKHLSSQKTRPGAAGWWRNFFIQRTDDNNVKIECTDALCGEQLSAANPSQRAKSHLVEQRKGVFVCHKRAAHGACQHCIAFCSHA